MTFAGPSVDSRSAGCRGPAIAGMLIVAVRAVAARTHRDVRSADMDSPRAGMLLGPACTSTPDRCRARSDHWSCVVTGQERDVVAAGPKEPRVGRAGQG